MQVSFENYKNLNLIKSANLVMFISEDHIENIIKTKGKCECGPICGCGENCECNKNFIQQAIYEFNYKGKQNETVLVGCGNFAFNKVILIGIGKENSLTKTIAEKIGYKTFKFLKNNKIKKCSFIFNSKIDEEGNLEETGKYLNDTSITLFSRLIFGFNIGEYNFIKYLTGDKLTAKSNSIEKVEFITKNPSELSTAINELNLIKENIFFCRDLVNEPANVIYPESYAKICKDLEKFGLNVEVLKVKDMEKLGMGSLLAIGQGSDNESHMVIIKWNGGSKDSKPIAFIGKGVTFDSGGLSLKPANAMDTMKCDMAGSAVVVSLMRLLAMRKAKVNAVGVIALVENMPSGKAVKVGDIVKSMSGQTIEVLNTDAEGRMILADALYYTSTRFEPKIMIDLATLTGAICVALGEQYAGLFTQDTEFYNELEKAGFETGETVWRMPLSKIGDFYDNQIDSDIADVRNTGKTRDAGATTAAQFLQRFTNNHPKWAHIDIAATAFVSQECFLTPKYATGYGVRLLNELIKTNYEE